MEDGFQVIVKIPYQISVPKTYATASEAATLTFLRSKDIPVPEVYGWASTTDNPVGIEYIIMEKLFNIPFASTGSLYFKSDIPPHLQQKLYAPGIPDREDDSKTYCIGLTTDYMFWYGKRAELQLDRGPFQRG
ncbi:phosphotransferase enzyme family protein [Nannizzia gypsea CBS 118893]|uniref:Phosphotransferase enzyme family protein n=1 Tax=Arthroderma gypseum (strain ATCC MYA-4604 / CBS 118893) TaxID=535722 RepID=E4UPB0_ARTGP|nr:phosphotransferase enzyme family protein [Nannizzia gypsea CBS 118893]EFQ99836.1 phosphotransferase enzyme family protein [Nannizzia gypsea CBS 118893]